MQINFVKYHSKSTADVYKNVRNKMDILKMLNSSGYTQIGDLITLKDGSSFNVKEIPRLDFEMLGTILAAKNNIMDFGSACYFKYTNSSGKSQAVFSMPGGSLSRPMSEYINGNTEYDRDTERYIHFWNSMVAGKPYLPCPGNPNFPDLGYSNNQIRSYLDEAGISNGFFSVKIGSKESELFFSNSEHCPVFTKEEYDLRYHTMTSSDFLYEKSVFNCLEPGTEITIAGEKYTLKDDFTLDIPYGTDIYDIQIPKHTHVSKVTASIDYKV